MEQSFDNFVTNTESREIVDRLKNLCENPSSVCSPVVLYGKSGLGKTHLCRAIKNTRRDVLLCSSEDIYSIILHIIDNNLNFELFVEAFANYSLIIDDAELLLCCHDLLRVNGEMIETRGELAQNLLIDLIERQWNQEYFVMLVFNETFCNGWFSEKFREKLLLGEILHLCPPDYDTRVRYCKEKINEYNMNLSDEQTQLIVELWGQSIPRIDSVLKTILARRNIRRMDNNK